MNFKGKNVLITGENRWREKLIECKKKMLAMPLPYWFIRLSQGLLPLPAFDWVMRNVFGIYDTMKDFKGR